MLDKMRKQHLAPCVSQSRASFLKLRDLPLRIDLSADTGKLAFSLSRNDLKDLALAVREVMSDAKRSHSSAQSKRRIHRPNAASYASNCLTSRIAT